MVSSCPPRLLLLAVVALAVVLAPPGAAVAGSSTVHIRVARSTEATFDDCGPAVTEESRESTHVILQVGGTDAFGAPTFLHRTLIIDLDGTWAANGETLRFAANVVVESPRISANGPFTVDFPDGSQRTGTSYTVLGEAVNGVQLRIKLATGRQVFVDAGRISYDVTFVLFADLSFVTLDQGNFAFAGPHPLVERGRDCPTIQQYLG